MASTDIQVTKVLNPFIRTQREFLQLDVVGRLAGEVAEELLPAIPKTVVINGAIISEIDIIHVRLRVGDNLVIIPKAAGGESGKQILMIVAMIALAVWLGPAVANFAMGVESAAGLSGMSLMMYNTIVAATVLGGGLLISSLMPKPSVEDNSDALAQSHSWNPQTLQSQGIPVPRWYGRNKLYGNVIAVNTEQESLTSQRLKLLLALGQGPCEGIDDAQVFINDQPYTAFSDVSFEEKKGLVAQTAVSYFAETKPEYAVNMLVVYGTARTYLLPDTDYDDLEIELAFDRGIWRVKTDDFGGSKIVGHSIGIKVEIRKYGLSWSTLAAENVTENKTAAARKTYRASQTYTGGAPVTIENGSKYEVRVTKTTTDKSSSDYGDQVRLGCARGILPTAFTYPRTALLGIDALATDQLSGSLSVSCIHKGAIVAVYTGSAWAFQWSDNPAWVLWDVLTQPVIKGAGTIGDPYTVDRFEGVQPGRLDLPMFYSLAQHCDTLVPDGEGGTEKRITFNGGFDAETTLWEAALKVCEIARCIMVWNGVHLTIAIDKPATVVQSFSDGNIIKGTFVERWLPQAEMVSEIEVHYRDALQGYERTTLTVYAEDIPTTSNKVSLDLFGITKASEAWRAGMLRLMQNLLLKSTVEFEADIDALACTIGDVIYVQSSIPDWGLGGRITAATGDTVTIDQPYTLVSGTNKILVRVYDSGTGLDTLVEKTIDSIDETGLIITIVGTFTITPAAGDVYMVGHETVVGKKYRILSLTRSQDQRATIMALEYDDAMYGQDEEDPSIPMAGYTEPGSDTTNMLTPPSWSEIETKYPTDLMFDASVLTADIPMFNGFVWTDNSPSGGSVAWPAHQILYKGTAYTVAAGYSSNKYIYWDQAYLSGGYLQGTDTLATAMGVNKWVVGVNISGTFWPAFGRKVIHGGLIEADTIDANHINVANLAAIAADMGNVTSGSITLSLGGDKRIRIDSSGIYTSIDAGANWKAFLGISGSNILLSFDGYAADSQIQGCLCGGPTTSTQIINQTWTSDAEYNEAVDFKLSAERTSGHGDIVSWLITTTKPTSNFAIEHHVVVEIYNGSTVYFSQEYIVSLNTGASFVQTFSGSVTLFEHGISKGGTFRVRIGQRTTHYVWGSPHDLDMDVSCYHRQNIQLVKS